MIGYVTVGADDLTLAQRFYSSFLPNLGYKVEISSEGLSYILPPTDGSDAHVDFYVKPPHDGKTATFGNGVMVAFSVTTQALVRALHDAALNAGGRNDGLPGFRAAYSATFYVGYLRDPQGNKIALYCNSPNEPRRPD